MIRNFLESIKKFDRRIKELYLFFGLHTVNVNLPRQYDQLFITGLGADPVQLGFLSSIRSVFNSIISAPSGWMADRYGIKKVILLGLSLTLTVSTIYSFADSWLVLLPALIMFGMSTRLVLPFVDILFVNYSKPEQRAMVMALSRTLWAIPSIFTPIIAAFLITSFGGLNVSGIRPLYYIQIILSLIIFVFVTIGLKTTKSDRKKDLGFIHDFRDMFKGERWLKRWIIMTSIQNISLNLALPFVSLWIVNVKGADQFILGIMGAVGIIVSFFLQIPAGRLADRIGRKKVFYLFRPFVYFGTILLIIAPSPEYLILASVLGYIGVFEEGFGGASMVSFIIMNFEMVPEEKRGRWMGFSGIFNCLSFPASILGGIIWQQGYMREILLLPIFFELLIMIPIFRTIPDTLTRSS